MASLPYPLNGQIFYGREGMARMPYPPIDCRSYIKIILNTYLMQINPFAPVYNFVKAPFNI